MARYAIGDIQGCYNTLERLLGKIGFNPGADTLYLVGDLVNRGTQSLQVLQWVYKHQDSVVTVLGNHDIYLLERYNNLLPPDNDETIQDVLNYAEVGKLIDYLRHCSILFQDEKYILVHAGIYPKMNFAQLIKINEAISNHLLADDYTTFLSKIYGNNPNFWSDEHSLIDQMKFVINASTRMRYVSTNDFSLHYKYKGELITQPHGLIPWFKTEFDPSIKKKILFGHWAALGFYHNNKVVSLDTGCVWGRLLTAFNLETYEIIQTEKVVV